MADPIIFAHPFNEDENLRLTTSVWDNTVAQWMMKTQLYVQNASTLWTPLILDANGRLQVSVKDSALSIGAATESTLGYVQAALDDIQSFCNQILDSDLFVETSVKNSALPLGASTSAKQDTLNNTITSLVTQNTNWATALSSILGTTYDPAVAPGVSGTLSARVRQLSTDLLALKALLPAALSAGGGLKVSVLDNGLPTGATDTIELNVTLNGAVQQLPSNVCKSFSLQAEPGNMGYVYVGRTNQVSATVHSYVLSRGGSITIQASNTNKYYVFGTNGDKVCGGGEV